MSSSLNNRLYENLRRDIFVLEDENNPRTSQISRIYPPTILDQVFDQLHPNQKNLREIIEDLRQEIINGGIGNIVFPITSINGKADGDTWLTANDLGLGRVDNTKDIDKPLSTPQRTAVMEILATHDFNVDLQPLLDHINDHSNPHKVSVENLNDDGSGSDTNPGAEGGNPLNTLIESLIARHNMATHSNIHFDIRRSLSTLWNRVDDIDQSLESRIGNVLDGLKVHYDDQFAHNDLFALKENLSNKVVDFSKTENNNHLAYPSTRAVINYVTDTVSEFNNMIPNIEDRISNIRVINSDKDLPKADQPFHHQAFILRRSPDNDSIQNGLAICRRNTAGDYYWDISRLGSISSFDPKYFLHRPGGLTLDMKGIIEDLLNIEGADESGVLSGDVLGQYLTHTQGDERYIHTLSIVTGDMDGCIKYYTNDDISNISSNIRVGGLHGLAFKEFITEHELREEAVHNRHLLSRSVDSRVIKEGSVTRAHLNDDLFKADKGSLLGNLNSNDGTVGSVSILQLSDILRPMIGGLDDLSIPEISPHTWEKDVMIPYRDGSYGMRFTGMISVLPNVERSTKLTDKISSKDYQIIDSGGYLRIDSELEMDAPLGGTNLTGHTYASITFDKYGVSMGSMSIGNRIDAPYDVWVRFIKRGICEHEYQYVLDEVDPTECYYVCSKCGAVK